MHIKDKIKLDKQGLMKHGAITIVALGDSITHGGVADGEIRYDTVYWERLRQKILAVRNYVPVNVVNAGIGGTTSQLGLEYMDERVLAFHPDLIIVCYGLNDVNLELEEFLSTMRRIFEKAVASGADVIYMTPNMLNTYVTEDTAKRHLEYAHITAEWQNNGKMDKYIEAAVALAKECGVPVCDCYAKWKKLSETEDTTKLLADHINHPIKEMHELFAESLFEMIFEDITVGQAVDEMTFQK